MRTLTCASVVLASAVIVLAGCAPSAKPVPGKAARFLYLVDVSTSPATINSDAVARAAQTRIGAEMKQEAKLGDSFAVFETGSADASRMVGHRPIVTGYNLRIGAARTQLIAQLEEVAQRYRAQGGDDATHLVQSLEAIHPDCSSGRDRITFISDGLQEDGNVSSVRALATGKPIHLTAPPGRYLAGCKVTFLGFGITADGSGEQQLLPTRQLATLRQGWLEYLTAAGIEPDDVSFVSAL